MKCKICGRTGDVWKENGWLLEDYRPKTGIIATCPECLKEPMVVIGEDGRAQRKLDIKRDPGGVY